MSQYHVNPDTGQTGRCTATIRCRFAQDAHFATELEAANHYQKLIHADDDPETNKFGVFTKQGQKTDEDYEVYDPEAPRPVTEEDKENQWKVYSTRGRKNKLNEDEVAWVEKLPLKNDLYYEAMSHAEEARSLHHLSHVERMLDENKLGLNADERYWAYKMSQRLTYTKDKGVYEAINDIEGRGTRNSLRDMVSSSQQRARQQLLVALKGFAAAREENKPFASYANEDAQNYQTLTGFDPLSPQAYLAAHSARREALEAEALSPASRLWAKVASKMPEARQARQAEEAKILADRAKITDSYLTRMKQPRAKYSAEIAEAQQKAKGNANRAYEQDLKRRARAAGKSVGAYKDDLRAIKGGTVEAQQRPTNRSKARSLALGTSIGNPNVRL